MSFSSLLSFLVIASSGAFGAPASGTASGGSSALASTTTTSTEPTSTIRFASTDPNLPLWTPESPPEDAVPIREQLGAIILGPDNKPLDLENADALAPPTTDSGFIGTLKWPFTLSKNRLQPGGWARQQNLQQMPLAKNLAGVNMRLKAGTIRELHWHTTAETQITSVDQDGKNYVANVNPGDLWYFPPGIPHSLQATGDNPQGSEFLLIFPDGNFDEDSTFMLGDWLAHTPASVIQKNFQVTDPAIFSHIPEDDLYIFPGTPPTTAIAPTDPQGTVPQPFSFNFSGLAPTPLNGGSIKVADSRNFAVSIDVAAAEVTVNPGGMRELHWHPTMDEWTFVIEGEARITVFASSGTANTFNYQAGDIAYIPVSMGHYVENTGNSTLKYLEIFNGDRVQDVSLSQWLALTPPELVKAHLGLDDAEIALLANFKEKAIVVGPATASGV